LQILNMEKRRARNTLGLQAFRGTLRENAKGHYITKKQHQLEKRELSLGSVIINQRNFVDLGGG